MKNKINLIFGFLLMGLLVFNITIKADSQAITNLSFSALIQSANADPEGSSTKYFKTYCSCTKGSGLNWEWCNMKTNCVQSEFGDLSSCSSTSCFPGCSC